MQKEIKKQMRALNIIYATILGSMSVIATIAAYFVSRVGALRVFDAENQAYIKSIVIIALLTGIPVSHVFFYKKIKHIVSTLTVTAKIKQYQTAFMMRIAVLNAIGVLAAIGYLVTADTSFLYMFAVIFILFLIHAPTRSKIINDLNLTEAEEEQFF